MSRARVSRYGFPSLLRLRKRREFLFVQRRGDKFVGRHYVFRYVPAANETGRLGVTVSKKAGKAHIRNRIKRVLREAYRLTRPPVTASWDIVAIPRGDLQIPARLDHAAADFEALGHRLQVIGAPRRGGRK